jgi:DNA-binding winged helix-turn-helix (wHTH) protein
VTPRLELNFPNPVERPTDLFDRASQLELIQESVASPTRRIVVIMGERVTGKTSLLNIVQAWAATQPGLAVLRLAPVTSRSELVEEILEGMASQLDTSLYGLGYRDATGTFIRSTVLGFSAVAAELSTQRQRTFLICLDELDSMLVNCPDDQSATEILDFILYISNTSLPIKFLFTLTRATRQIMRADATPFTTAARIADLTPWNEQETWEFIEWLISPNLVVDASAHKLLFAEGGGHPYLTKAILQRIVDAAGACPANSVISEEQVRAGVVEALSTPEVHFTLYNIVTVHFSPGELLVLHKLAKAPGPLASDEFVSSMQALSELRRRHYVRNVENGFVLAFGLLGRWLLGQAPTSDDRDGHRERGTGTGIPRLRLDESQRRVFLGRRELQVSQQEYRFLHRLMRDAGTVVDRAALAATIWPEESGFEGGRDARLSQLVHRLRIMLGDDDKDPRYIETRRGFGFSVIPQNVEHIGGDDR